MAAATAAAAAAGASGSCVRLLKRRAGSSPEVTAVTYFKRERARRDVNGRPVSKGGANWEGLNQRGRRIRFLLRIMFFVGVRETFLAVGNGSGFSSGDEKTSGAILGAGGAYFCF